ncbi:MAG: glycosyltransferase family 4 protein [Candidatus Nanopelagicales bacterium]
MSAGRVLVSVQADFRWGGLHENIWYSARGIHSHGWDVTVACRESPLADKLAADGIGVHLVADWDDWSGDAEHLAQQSWDVVHGHSGRSRKLAVFVHAATGARLVNTFHGDDSDGVAQWGDRASSLISVSRSIAGMVADVRGVDPTKVHVVPNAVRDELVDRPPLTWGKKVASGTGRILVACRLDPDKLAVLEAVDEVTAALSNLDGPDWVVQVVGDGSAAGTLREHITTRDADARHVRFEMTGFVESEAVPDLMRGAVLTVASGRGAAQSLAVGTPVVAFGSRGLYGLQAGRNLRYGLWGHFGGYRLPRVDPITPVASDVRALLRDEERYRHVQEAGRAVVSGLLRQSDADRALDAIYRLR